MATTKASAGDFSQSAWAHLLYLSVLAALVAAVPVGALDAMDRHAILAIGIIGTWRYGWNLFHFVRALIYQRIVFPRMAARAVAIASETPPRAIFLVTSFRIDAHTTSQVYRAVFAAALAHDGPSTIIASVVEMGDQRIVKQLFSRIVGGARGDIRLVLVRIAGTGKRDALAFGFRAIRASVPEVDENDIVMVIDGDSMVPSDIVARCAPLLRLDPKIGALTTDEMSELREGRRIFHHWYSMRFAQRQIYMSSMGLAKRVLTLTGRMSMFRATLVCDPDFIRQVEVDTIDHWRIGRYRLLTGDDKSTWFWLLRNGYKMVYVPDLIVHTVEVPPQPDFIPASLQLMTRWFGNMLRTSSRAIALGPGRIGLFTWWSLIDQRLSMWTSLTGLTFAVLTSITYTPWAMVVYAAWIMASRYLIMLLLLSQRREVSAWYPLLLIYNQIVGSLVKIYALTHPDRQRWTRQKTTFASSHGRGRALAISLTSHAANILSLLALVTAVGVWVGTFPIPFALRF